VVLSSAQTCTDKAKNGRETDGEISKKISINIDILIDIHTAAGWYEVLRGLSMFRYSHAHCE
jgi:hypothetical protein